MSRNCVRATHGGKEALLGCVAAWPPLRGGGAHGATITRVSALGHVGPQLGHVGKEDAVSMCSRKRKYTSEVEAHRAMEARLEAVVHIGGRGPTGWPNVYQCPRCEYWHWGHTDRR